MPRLYRYCWVVLLGMVVLAGCDLPGGDDIDPYTPAELEHFDELAFGDPEEGASAVRRWTEPIRIRVEGDPSADDLAILDEAVDEVRVVIGSQIDLDVVPPDDDAANATIYFVPREKAEEIHPEIDREHIGYFWIWWSGDDAIYRARMIILIDEVTDSTRPYIIRHELMHSLGFMFHAAETPTSIMHQPWEGAVTFSEKDETAMEMLYRSDLHPGMTRSQAHEVLQSLSRW